MSDRPDVRLSQIRAAVLPDLLISVIGPLLIYRLAAPHMSTIAALLLAGVLPLIRIGFSLIRFHRLNLLGVFSLLTTALKIFLALVLNDVRLVLVGDSFITALYGIILLGSLPLSPPLLIRLIGSVLPNASSVQDLQLQQRVSQAGARSLIVIITAIWGVGLLLEFGLQVILAFNLSVEQVLLIGPIVRYGTWAFLVLLAVAISWIRRRRMPVMREDVSSEPLSEPTSTLPSHE